MEQELFNLKKEYEEKIEKNCKSSGGGLMDIVGAMKFYQIKFQEKEANKICKDDGYFLGQSFLDVLFTWIANTKKKE